MAYNNYQYPNYQYPTLPQTATPAQIYQSGFISVMNEQEARNYPLAPGNSITFKDESGPYVYVKTMGFSQFDSPTFKKYKLTEVAEDKPEKKESEDLRKLYEELNDKVEMLRKSINLFTKEPEDE